jgi:ubiquitin-activating enzyme E1
MKGALFISPWLSLFFFTQSLQARPRLGTPFLRFIPPRWLGVGPGGDAGNNSILESGDVVPPADDERYSRQVFTLGARAHALVRSSTVYVDGPPSSGLLYECVKNFALSGVGSIVIWESDSKDDISEQHYHDGTLDDLGKAYYRAAVEESGLQMEQDDTSTPKTFQQAVLAKYIRCLNPAVRVYSAKRGSRPKSLPLDSHGVVLSIDRPYETQVKLNDVARDQNHKFVAVETAGVYGRVFCDFGPSFEVFDADGEVPRVTPLDCVLVQDDEELLVRAIESEKHDVSTGDTVQFQMSNGAMMAQLFTVVKVLSPQRIIVKLDPNCKSYTKDTLPNLEVILNEGAASYSRIKNHVKLSFLPLHRVISEVNGGAFAELFTPCDFDKSHDQGRLKSVLASFQALSAFVQSRERLPTANDMDDFQQLIGKSLQSVSAHDKHIGNFLSCCKGKMVPVQSLFGALGAQEALKALTGLYMPVNQILLYDCDELLSDSAMHVMEESTSSSGLSYILGRNVEEKVNQARIFVVGAGAIGCELLKNLAAMGCGTGKNGRISLTDMDSIEKSNLSRQLLFRESNIGEFKSTAARTAIMQFNPAVHLNAHTSKVGQESDGPFGDDFWSSSIDIVLNALDNMEARLFVDEQCVAYQKALIDAGTLGPKGNVQVVVPHQSESYGSSVDPPESEIPVCTLKNFPYAISHTIQWGRDLFDGLYNRRPKQANDFATAFGNSKGKIELAETLIRDLGDAAAIEATEELLEDIYFASRAQSDARSEAIGWAVQLATRLFHDAVYELLREHPLDSRDEDGDPFWSGTRKVPQPIRFSHTLDSEDTSMIAANENLMEFVQAAARLRFEMLFGKGGGHVSVEEAREALMKAVTSEYSSGQSYTEDEKASAEAILGKLQAVTSVAKRALQHVDFEKDDDDNGHVAFVKAASNLRAMCYGIPPVDAMETRRVAGKIIPAMITTTAVVSALSCVELLKLIQEAPLTRHRNAFINLALPFFAFTVPLPAEEVAGPHDSKFTLWDKIVINQQEDADDLTLKRLIRQVKKTITHDPEGLDVSTVSAGDCMIYANFLHGRDKALLSQSIWDLASAAMSEEDDEDVAVKKSTFATHVDLRVTVEDTKTGEAYELPPVRLHRARGKT